MNKTIPFIVLAFLCSTILSFAQDWASIPVPADAGTGKIWELQENVSDDFNYTFNETNSKVNFGLNDKWYNFYHNQWDGPGTTYWKYNHVSVDGSNLVLKASRWDKNNQSNPQYPYPGAQEEFKMNRPDNGVNSGCITSNNKVVYPVYVESAISVANIALASCFWLLSPDDTQEIDIIENYGGVDGFKHVTHISHHSFIRSPFHDYQPRDWNSWWPDPRVNTNYGWGDWSWNNGNRRYLRLGVYWISPNHFEYYVDGELVRVMYENAIATRMNGTWEYTYYNSIHPANTQDQWGNNIGGQPVNITSGFQTGYSDVTLHATSSTYSFVTHQAASQASNGINVIDPGNYQGGNGFTKEMDIIINVESQSWLVSRNETPLTSDLNDPSQNQMKIDWVRVYKPKNDPNGGNDRDRKLSFENINSFIPSGANLPTVSLNETISVDLDYATAITSGIEEDLYYVATEIRLLDDQGNAVKRSSFEVSISGDAPNSNTTTFDFTIPTTFSDGSPVPTTSELSAGESLQLTIFMSLNADSEFYAYNTQIVIDNEVVTGRKNRIDELKAIFPNPTKGIININAGDQLKVLMNTLGEELYKTTNDQIDLSNYPTGIYFIQLGEKRMKIIKQ